MSNGKSNYELTIYLSCTKMSVSCSKSWDFIHGVHVKINFITANWYKKNDRE